MSHLKHSLQKFNRSFAIALLALATIAQGSGILFFAPQIASAAGASVAIDKQVSVDNTNWLEVGHDNLSGAPTVAEGSTIYERVVVTNTGSADLTDASVSDANQPGVSGFDFGGASTFSLTAGNSVTSDVVSFVANASVLDTATVTATDPDSNLVSASDQAAYSVSVPPVKNTTTGETFSTIQAAIDDSNTSAGDTIELEGDLTVPSQVSVNKEIKLDGNGHTASVSGTGYRFLITAGGTVFEDLKVNKTDTAGVQNIIGIQANDVTIDNVDFTGQFNIGDSDVSRALEVSAVTGLTVENSSFEHLRQPAYVNTATGSFTNNYVADTNGWVLVQDSNITFSGNTWGTAADANVIDIAIIQQGTGDNTYTCPIMAQIKADNNDATIDNQVLTAPCTPPDTTAPTLTAALSSYTLGASGSDATIMGTTTDTASNISSVTYALWQRNGDGSKGAVVRNWSALPAADGAYDEMTEELDSQVGLNTLPEGQYIIGLRPYDAAGNKGSGVDLTFTVDNTKPTIEFTSPKRFNNDHYQEAFKSLENIAIKGTDPSGIKNTVVHIYNADNTPSSAWCGAAQTGDTGTCDTSGLVQGVYYVKVAVTDNAGNSTFATKDFSIDTHAPGTEIITPTPGTSVTLAGDGSFTVSGTYAEHGPAGISHINLYVNPGSSYSYAWSHGQGKNTYVHATLTPNGDGTGTWTAKFAPWKMTNLGIGAGDHFTVTAVPIDNVDNGTTKRVEAVYTLGNVSLAAPQLESPHNGANVKGKSLTQSWSDGATDIDHYIYESYNDAGATSLRWHQELATTSKTADNVADATYWWRVKAVDSHGNESDWSPLWKLTVDNEMPGATIETPAASSTVTFANDGTLTVNGTYTEHGPSGINVVHLLINPGNGYSYGWNNGGPGENTYVNATLTPSGSGGTWAAKFPASTLTNLNLSAGDTFTVTAVPIDNANNGTTKRVEAVYTLGTTAP